MIGEVAGLISGCGVLGVPFMECASWEEIVCGGRLVSSVSVVGMRSCVGGELSVMGCSGGSTGVDMGSSCLGSEGSSSPRLLDGCSSGGLGSGGSE